MYLIVGLGNPGMKYKNTYHNVGFMVVDALAKRLKVKLSKKECDALLVQTKFKGEDVVLAKPQTYMNLSGTAVKKLVKHYGVDESCQLIVCYDDADLPLGKTRMREEGSAGSHNGMKNIVAELYTTAFRRVRIGIKTQKLANGEIALLDMVLSRPDYEDKGAINSAVEEVADALLSLVGGADYARVEERLNRKK